MFIKKQTAGHQFIKAIPSASVIFVEFQGAVCDVDDAGNLIDFQPRGPIVINVNAILGYYDHTILIKDKKIRVMETCNQISTLILEAMRI